MDIMTVLSTSLLVVMCVAFLLGADPEEVPQEGDLEQPEDLRASYNEALKEAAALEILSIKTQVQSAIDNGRVEVLAVGMLTSSGDIHRMLKREFPGLQFSVSHTLDCVSETATNFKITIHKPLVI